MTRPYTSHAITDLALLTLSEGLTNSPVRADLPRGDFLLIHGLCGYVSVPHMLFCSHMSHEIPAWRNGIIIVLFMLTCVTSSWWMFSCLIIVFVLVFLTRTKILQLNHSQPESHKFSGSTLAFGYVFAYGSYSSLYCCSDSNLASSLIPGSVRVNMRLCNSDSCLDFASVQMQS